jgi:long-chain acyl-CoA synthetase
MKELVYARQLVPAAERFAHKTAFFDGDYEATYETHLDRVLRLTDGLGKQLGVRRDDRFAVMALNGHRYLELYHAGFLGGGVINPLNLRLAPRELAFILADSGTKVVFTDAPFAHVIEQVREEAGIEHVVLMGEGDAPHTATHDELVAAGEPRLPEEPEESDPVVLMYTGGTTGLPKGVLLDHRAEMLNLYHTMLRWGLEDEFVFLHQTPMFHAASMGGVLGIPASGASSTFVPLFDPEPVLDLIEARRVTMTVMVPTMIAMIFQHPAFTPERLESLRILTYGASPMPQALLEVVMQALPGCDVYQGYGMTEAAALLTSLGPEDHRAGVGEHPGSRREGARPG